MCCCLLATVDFSPRATHKRTRRTVEAGGASSSTGKDGGARGLLSEGGLLSLLLAGGLLLAGLLPAVVGLVIPAEVPSCLVEAPLCSTRNVAWTARVLAAKRQDTWERRNIIVEFIKCIKWVRIFGELSYLSGMGKENQEKSSVFLSVKQLLYVRTISPLKNLQVSFSDLSISTTLCGSFVLTSDKIYSVLCENNESVETTQLLLFTVDEISWGTCYIVAKIFFKRR